MTTPDFDFLVPELEGEPSNAFERLQADLPGPLEGMRRAERTRLIALEVGLVSSLAGSRFAPGSLPVNRIAPILWPLLMSRNTPNGIRTEVGATINRLVELSSCAVPTCANRVSVGTPLDNIAAITAQDGFIFSTDSPLRTATSIPTTMAHSCQGRAVIASALPCVGDREPR